MNVVDVYLLKTAGYLWIETGECVRKWMVKGGVNGNWFDAPVSPVCTSICVIACTRVVMNMVEANGVLPFGADGAWLPGIACEWEE